MSFDAIRSQFSSSKFLPPVLNLGIYLHRDRLLDQLLEDSGNRKRLILIDAQAGQGKTTLAAQYLHLKGDSFAWYQVGPEDRDPVHFLTALLLGLMKSLPAFQSPTLEKMIISGEVSPLDIPRFVQILLKDLRPNLPDSFWLILDDIHLLENAPASRQLLALLTEAASPGLQFLFLTRRPVELFPAISPQEILHLGNKELALTPIEIFELYNEVLSIPLDGNAARTLYEHTEGWIMGLLLSARSVEAGRDTAGLLNAPDGSSIDYFRKEILTTIPEDLKEPLLKLSMLEEVPSELAEIISGKGGIRDRLNDLATKNLFIRSLDERGSTFRFHHLFHEVLRSRAEKELPPEAHSDLHRGAADYYLQREDVEKGLLYLVRLKDYQAVEKLLERTGLRFVAQNRIQTLGALLGGVAEEVVAEHPWIAYFRGIVLIESQPPQALPILEKAGRLFADRGDARGELLTLAQRILFHTSIDCRFNLGPELLQRADALFPDTRELLDDRSLLFVAMHLSLGFSLMRVEPEKARAYANMALSLAKQGDLPNLEAFARFNIGMQNAFFGNHRQMLKEIENAYPLLIDPQVGIMSRMHLRILQLNALALTGNLENFFVQEEDFRRETEGNFVLETIAGPILLVNKIDAALDEDRLDLALERIERGLSWGGPAESPHLRSQFLHYKAFVNALLGRGEEARTAAAESHRLRRMAGGEIWQIVSDMILGGALAHAGCEEEAEKLLERAIQSARNLDEGFLRAASYAHRAFSRLRTGRREEGLSDLRGCLECMRENGYTIFFTWTHREMLPLLQEAVRVKIEPEYARLLARERLGMIILEDGTSLPLLEIRAFGDLSLSLSHGERIAGRDLTPAQRDLLGLLLCAPALELGQEEIQSLMWPESPAGKARSKFDNLLSRLRRVLDERLRCDSSRHYLVLEKGLLRLTHCRIDAREFKEKSRLGMRRFRQEELWQAGNAFYSAHHLWRGDFLPEVKESDRLRDCRQDLQELYFEMSLGWGRILESSGQLDEAAGVLEKAWKLDRSHDGLAQALYRIHQDRKDVRKTRQVLRLYEEALLDLECAPDEVREILRDLAL